MAQMPQPASNPAASGPASLLGDFSVEEATQLLENSRVAMEQAVDTAADFIRERPLACLAGALAVGYLIGKIASR